jgi:hypothetical protein
MHGFTFGIVLADIPPFQKGGEVAKLFTVHSLEVCGSA